MEITINRKKVQLQFGVRFLRELDKTDGMEIQGQQYGFAIQTALPKLEGYDPVTLAKLIRLVHDHRLKQLMITWTRLKTWKGCLMRFAV